MNRIPFGLYGIFGFPLGHTLSPVMQEAAFRAAGLKAFYLPFEVRAGEFRRLLGERRRLLLDGFNVTVPYKGIVLKFLDRLTSRAKAIKAVNTVYRKGRYWIGDNTDCFGFLTSLRKEGKFNPRGKRVLLLGAGGAARAVAYGLAQSRAKEIRIINRERFRARRQRIIQDFKGAFPKTSFMDYSLNIGNLKQALKGVQAVINATSAGVLFKSRRIIPQKLIPKADRKTRILFCDLVYHKETPFMKDAKSKGHPTLGGMGMLLHQGAEAFRLWTGKRAPIEVMRAELKEALSHR